jgi:hypothetical protein
MKEQFISREDAESSHSDHGAAFQDSKIIQQISSLHSDVALQQAVKEESTRNAQIIAELRNTHKYLDFSGAYKDLQSDQVALQILSDKTYMQRMLQGKSVQYQRVSRRNDGRPIRNFGVGLISLDRRIDSLIPVVSLGYSAHHALNSQIKVNSPGQDEKKFRVKLNVTESTVTAAFKKATGNALPPDEQNELRIHSRNNDLVKTLKKLNDWYAIIPEGKKDQFKNDIATAAYVNLVTPVKTMNGQYLRRRNEFSLLNIPLEVKGVQLSDKQILRLAMGRPVAVSGLRDSRSRGPYDAILSMNMLRGNVQENPTKEVDAVNKGQKQKLLTGTESSRKRRQADFPKEDKSAESIRGKHQRFPRL